MRIIGNNLKATRQVNVVASGTMPNGKAVNINSDGTASVVAETSTSPDLTYGTFTRLENEATQWLEVAADPFNSNRFALVDIDDVGNKHVSLYIITRSGSSITVSSQISVFDGGNSSNSKCIWDVVTENQLLICYNDNNNRFDAIVATISGSAGSETATFGTKLDVSNLRFTAGSDDSPYLAPIGTTGSYLALYTGTSNYTYYNILTISGTTVSRDTSSGSSGTVLKSVAMQSAMRASIDPNDSTKGFAVGVNDSTEDLELYPLTFSGTGTGMTVSAGTMYNLKSAEYFHDSTSSPDIKYLNSSTRLLVVAKRGGNPNSRQVDAFVFTDDGGGSYTEYTSTTLINPDGYTLYFRCDFTSPVADVNTFLVLTVKDGSPRYVYGAVGTINSSTNAITFTTPSRVDSLNGNAALYGGYAVQSDDNATALTVVSGTDNDGNQRPYVRLVQSGGTTTNIDAESFIGISQSGAASGSSLAVSTKGSVADNLSGLTSGQSYYVQTDGTLGTTPANPSIFAGTAVAANKLIVKG